MKILLIEDDPIFASMLVQSLTNQRYIVDQAEDGQMGWEYAQSTTYNLIVIDVGLPKLDGITLCQKLRYQGSTIPILLITAKDGTSERIRGLDAGADDYLIKPIDIAEFQARVRALLRRGEVSHSSILEIGNLQLNPVTCQVHYAHQPITLTPKEYSLLELLMRNPARVFSRAELIEYLWSFDDPPQEESVKAHIKGLRQKLKAVGAAEWIENVYGLGYRLSAKLQTTPSVSVDSPQPAIEISLEQQFNQAKEKLWNQYQDLLIERLAILQHLAIALTTNTLLPSLRNAAEQAAHKLAGVLGMFDLEQGTEIAQKIEQNLEGDQPLTFEQIQLLHSYIHELEKLLPHSMSEPDQSPLSFPTSTPPNLEINLSPNVNSLPEYSVSEISPRLLLIDSDLEFGKALQSLADSMGLAWQQIPTLVEAKTWLNINTPEVVVFNDYPNIKAEDRSQLIIDLAKRTPPIPVLVLTSTEGLMDRVTVARAGGRRIFVKPVTPTQIWEATSQLLHASPHSKVNVLVVDDDPLFLATLRPVLEPWRIRMTGLIDPLRFWEVLNSVSPDLLILDVEMSPVSGIELCQTVRADPHWQGLPIVFLTAHCDSKTIQQVFAAGADDYVSKPVMGPELLTRITNRLERTRLLQTLSTKDPITGLANYLQSSQELEQQIQKCQQLEQPFSLGVLSFSQLHDINLEYGHLIGYQVLQRWGRLFQGMTTVGVETIGYWGNGEFVVGMPGLTQAEAQEHLSDILISLRQQVFTTLEGQRFQVVCEVKITEFPTQGQTLQQLYQQVHHRNG
ncbi:response regulator [Planktothrix sp. FACHB-1365]|uniref:response regulator n=1 Tax=Planktothrix sp. FACHB-1365 TaxID=2692855 RepID=UPI0016851FBF|nr:response regulator [Planktothrix sp. FACHB-1365]MBD2483652.1 response regulator [Planktothrix sp. FACHB-1365]